MINAERLIHSKNRKAGGIIMKERLKGLLALCLMVALLTVAPVTVSAEETAGEDIAFHTSNALVFADRLYPGDVIVGNGRTEWPDGYAECGFPFFIARYISKGDLSQEAQQELQTQVFDKGLMQESDFKGIYRYWDMPWEDYSVLCKRITECYEKPDFQIIPDAEKTCLPGYEYLTYAWGDEFPLLPEADNPKVTCFDWFYGYAGNTGVYSYGVRLPSVDQLFGSEYAYGYHYAAKRLTTQDWQSVQAENPQNVPSGIVQAM